MACESGISISKLYVTREITAKFFKSISESLANILSSIMRGIYMEWICSFEGKKLKEFILVVYVSGKDNYVPTKTTVVDKEEDYG